MRLLFFAVAFFILSVEGYTQAPAGTDYEYAAITVIDSTIDTDIEFFVEYLLVYDNKGRLNQIKIQKEICNKCTASNRKYYLAKITELLNERKKIKVKAKVRKGYKNLTMKSGFLYTVKSI